MSKRPDLVVQRPEGLYCPPGDFYIDPWRPVDRAVITHAHADHARRGHGHYLAAAPAEGVLRARLGDIRLQTLAYGEPVVSERHRHRWELNAQWRSRLENAGLVTTRKIGRTRTCRLGIRRLEEEAAWIEQYRRLWAARFDALDRVVEELKKQEKSVERKKRG